MKSNVIMTVVEVPVKKFPWIGVGVSSGVVVLFTSEREGTVIGKLEGSRDDRSIGQFGNSWSPSSFVALDGSVTLSN